MESRCSVQERTRTIRTAPVAAFILGCLGITLRWNLHRKLTVMFYPVMLDEIDKVSSMHRCREGSHRHSAAQRHQVRHTLLKRHKQQRLMI